jgi:hypothetical protein
VCPVKICICVLLFSLVGRELFSTLCTKLTTSGHSSEYILSLDSTARKAHMTCLHADSIVPFDHEQFAVVKLCLAFSSLYTRRTTLFLKWLPLSDIHNRTTTPHRKHSHQCLESSCSISRATRQSHKYPLKSSLRSSKYRYFPSFVNLINMKYKCSISLGLVVCR